jgi:hypothetical protein
MHLSTIRVNKTPFPSSASQKMKRGIENIIRLQQEILNPEKKLLAITCISFMMTIHKSLTAIAALLIVLNKFRVLNL